MDTKNIVIGVLAVLTLFFGLNYFSPNSLGAASGPAHWQKESFLQGLAAGGRDQLSIDNAGKLTVGATGTAVTQLNFASCDLIGSNASQAASTTLPYDCAVTGVTSSSKVIALLASSTPRGGSSSWEIVGAIASSTSNFVTVLLTNNGPAAVPSVSSVGSSTAVWFFR